MKTTGKILGGIIIGATLGAAAGLLLAPASGRKTRKRIKDESRRLSDQFADSVASTLETAKKSYNKKLDEYAKNGKSSIDHMKERVKV